MPLAQPFALAPGRNDHILDWTNPAHTKQYYKATAPLDSTKKFDGQPNKILLFLAHVEDSVETPRERPALGSAMVPQVAPGPDRFVDVTTTSTPGPNVSPVLASVHELVVPVTRPRGGHAPARSRYRMAQKGPDGRPQQRVNRSLVVADLRNPTITR